MTQRDWDHLANEFVSDACTHIQATNLEFYGEMMRTLVAKGHDYNDGTADRLQNFKEIAEHAGIDPRLVALVLAAKHWDAISRHCRGKRCTAEPVRQRLIDLANYCVLLAGLEADLAPYDKT